ncbi:MAG: PilN domain-containing protein [Deltaproteobacteria bacterium]|nr:PilN domain-containing protein [Candidatus Anaeroferrophillacea bacterium]
MIRINLLPVRAERKKQTLRNQMAVAMFVLALTIGGIGGAAWYQRHRLHTTDAALKRTERQIKALQPVIDKINRYKEQKAELERKIGVIAHLDDSRREPLHALHDLNRLRPEKLWYTSLNRKDTRLEIKGIAIDNETIVEFLNNLSRSMTLGQAELMYLRSHSLQDLELKEFLVNVTLSPATAPPADPQGQS